MRKFKSDEVMENVMAFTSGSYSIETRADIWVETFKYVLSHHDQIQFEKEKMHSFWVVNLGHIRRKTADDDLVLSVLKLTLPGYRGNGISLYRGESGHLYDSGKIGFSWTSERGVAEMFARGLNSIESDGILLEAYAPENAILAPPNSHSLYLQENEYICDPGLLQNIKVIQKFPKLNS